MKNNNLKSISYIIIDNMKPNYKNSVIYKIYCKDDNIKDIYIGSTTNFRNRKYDHKCNCYNINQLNLYNLKVYKFIRDNGGWENWDMIIIEEFECENKLELIKKEREYIEKLNASLNSDIPSRTVKEYRQDKKNELNEYNKNYYKNNEEFRKNRILYNTNRNKLQYVKDKRNQKIECSNCGLLVSKSNIKRHQLSNKCKDLKIKSIKN